MHPHYPSFKHIFELKLTKQTHMYTVVWLPFPSPGSAWSHPVPLPAAPRVHPPPPPRSRSPCVQQFAPFLWICPFWTFYRKWPSMGTTLPALPPVATGWQQRSPLVRGRPHCACRVWGLWGGGRSPSLGSGPRAGADGVPLLVSPTPGPSGTPSAPQPGFLGGRGRGRTPPAPEAQLPRGVVLGPGWAQQGGAGAATPGVGEGAHRGGCSGAEPLPAAGAALRPWGECRWVVGSAWRAPSAPGGCGCGPRAAGVLPPVAGSCNFQLGSSAQRGWGTCLRPPSSQQSWDLPGVSPQSVGRPGGLREIEVQAPGPHQLAAQPWEEPPC